MIGCGGTGGYLAIPLVKTLQHYSTSPRLKFQLNLIDGDSFEEHNIGRQLCSDKTVGYNKADILKLHVDSVCSYNELVDVEAVNMYVTKDNVNDLLLNELTHEDELVNITILCVDNNETRKQVMEAMNRIWSMVSSTEYVLDSICPHYIINCGNEYVTGNVQFINEVTQDLFEVHPETKKTTDVNPGEHCTEEAEKFPQLAIANNMCAAIALNYVYLILSTINPQTTPPDSYQEVYFDISQVLFATYCRPKKDKKRGR